MGRVKQENEMGMVREEVMSEEVQRERAKLKSVWVDKQEPNAAEAS